MCGEVLIASSGKYFGWFIGRESIRSSFAAPLDKFQDRVQVIVDGAAPAPLALRRYNQTAVTVLSFVSQFAVPGTGDAGGINLNARQHTAIHRVLRMPALSMPRTLMHAISFCT